MFPIRTVALTWVCLTSLDASAQEWSRFRGPNGSGQIATAGTLPTRWDSDSSVCWKTPVPRGASSPIVIGNLVVITGYSGYAADPSNPGNREELKLHILAYDATTGQNLWDLKVPASPQEQAATPRISDHGYASPTPCSDGQLIFASFGPSGVVCCDLKGEKLWHREVGHGTAGFGAAASPIVHGDLLIVNASIESETLFGLDKQTGEIRWQVDGIQRAWTTPSIVTLASGNAELVIHYKDEIVGIEPATGQQLWTCEGVPDYIVPCAVVDGEMIYCSGGRQNQTIALRAGGRSDVTDSHKLWQVTMGANVTSPLLHEGHLYWAHDRSLVQCIRASDGATVYQKRLASRDRVYASIVYGDGKFYVLQRDGTTLVLAASPEYQELAINRLGEEDEQFNATPAIAANALYLRSTHALYKLAD